MALPQTNITAYDGIDIPTRADPANWDQRSEDGWGRLKPGADQHNVLAGQVNVMATAANNSASTAAQAAIDAQGYRNEANGAKNDANQAKTDAQAARAGAETARDAAQGYSEALAGTSSTSLVVGIGVRTFTGAGLAGKKFTPQQTLKAVSPLDANKYMVGTVSAYTSNGAQSSLTLLVSDVNSLTNGSTGNSWSIAVSGVAGPPGPVGGLNGGNLAGSLNEKQAADVPVSASPDIWSGAGNVVPLVGDGTWSDLPDAPQAGTSRTVRITGLVLLKAGAKLHVQGGTQRLRPGDRVEVLAEGIAGPFSLTIQPALGHLPAMYAAILAL
ncbi:hypothetical protein IP91_00129 [Pseudoduganella lurida]|uniref:Uncharacterized protein n=1 Tax=Pseudoduganella lurida TaxID=1036180 RepID=A0A562RKD5_9BURK|nr:hypothetical protein [Pseudoduganella lurida]TWI69064.1 hypothetical protein IP91_00129 [Pseudoduganella lurida]